MPTVRIQKKNYSESIMVLKLKDGSGIVLQHKDPVQEKRSKAKAEQKNFLHFM